MAYGVRMGRRIYATDGSAFFTCSICQRSVAVALHEMHKQECLLNRKRQLLRSRNYRDRKKRAREVLGFEHRHQSPSSPISISDDDDDRVELTPPPPLPDELIISENPNPPFRSGGRIGGVDLDQMPRSAFRIFMESYQVECGLDDWFEIDRTGEMKWKMMSKEERKPYVDKEKKLDSEHMQSLISEEWRLDGGDYSGLESSSSVNKAPVDKKSCRR